MSAKSGNYRLGKLDEIIRRIFFCKLFMRNTPMIYPCQCKLCDGMYLVTFLRSRPMRPFFIASEGKWQFTGQYVCVMNHRRNMVWYLRVATSCLTAEEIRGHKWSFSPPWLATAPGTRGTSSLTRREAKTRWFRELFECVLIICTLVVRLSALGNFAREWQLHKSRQLLLRSGKQAVVA